MLVGLKKMRQMVVWSGPVLIAIIFVQALQTAIRYHHDGIAQPASLKRPSDVVVCQITLVKFWTPRKLYNVNELERCSRLGFDVLLEKNLCGRRTICYWGGSWFWGRWLVFWGLVDWGQTWEIQTSRRQRLAAQDICASSRAKPMRQGPGGLGLVCLGKSEKTGKGWKRTGHFHIFVWGTLMDE